MFLLLMYVCMIKSKGTCEMVSLMVPRIRNSASGHTLDPDNTLEIEGMGLMCLEIPSNTEDHPKNLPPGQVLQGPQGPQGPQAP